MAVSRYSDYRSGLVPFSPSSGKGLSKRFLVLSVLATLLLVTAVPGANTLLTAKHSSHQAHVAQGLAPNSPDEEARAVAPTNEHSSLPDDLQERFSQGAGEGGQDSWSGPKRLRSVLPKDNVAQSLGVIAPILRLEPMTESEEPDFAPALSEPAPKDDALPQELLVRPPPAN